MRLIEHKALQWANGVLGVLSYYYEFDNGNTAHVTHTYEEDDRGRMLFNVFYNR